MTGGASGGGDLELFCLAWRARAEGNGWERARGSQRAPSGKGELAHLNDGVKVGLVEEGDAVTVQKNFRTAQACQAEK
jgi:hypothetical protein